VSTSDGAMTLMVINKDLNNANPIAASITNFNATGNVQRWQLTAGNIITHLPDMTLTSGVLNDTVPSQSITLYVIPAVVVFNLQAAASNQAGQLTLWLTGQAGQSYTLQSSPDLIHWVVLSTNTLTSNSIPYPIATTNTSKMFYRGLFNSP